MTDDERDRGDASDPGDPAGVAPRRVRLATPADAGLLRDLEASAQRAFDAVPALAWLATAPVPLGRFDALVAGGGVWILEDGAVACGFLAATVEADALHLVELDVRADRQQQGLGTALIAHAVGEAQRRGLPALTLTTFREVPWNAPAYARRGFRLLGADALGPRLEALLAAEAAAGLPDRCAMRRPV